MALIDRRSGRDRRATERFSVNIDVEWEKQTERKKGTMSDLSMSGCFVLCSGDVIDGDAVRIFVPLTDGMKVEFHGEVVNHVYEIGFAVRFVELSQAHADFLAKFISTLKKR